jgi:hypothetical protein
MSVKNEAVLPLQTVHIIDKFSKLDGHFAEPHRAANAYKVITGQVPGVGLTEANHITMLHPRAHALINRFGNLPRISGVREVDNYPLCHNYPLN